MPNLYYILNFEFSGPVSCDWIPLPLVGTRLIIVGFFGTTVAVISIIENLVFSIILFKKYAIFSVAYSNQSVSDFKCYP